MTEQPHPLRCETCNFSGDLRKTRHMTCWCPPRKTRSLIEFSIWKWIREYGCASHSDAKSTDKVLDELSQLCAYLHYSHTENERMARETKNKVARDILKGRMFEDMMILEALEELRVKGKIELRRQQKEREKE
jgi:hypothetical protein